MAVLDFNKDGAPDLAVGAPSVGSEQLTYKVRLEGSGEVSCEGSPAGRVLEQGRSPPSS